MAAVTCSPPRQLQIITKQSISAGEVYLMICVEWAILVWRKSVHFWWRYALKTIITFLFPVALSGYVAKFTTKSRPLWLFDLKYAFSVTLVQHYVPNSFYSFPSLRKLEAHDARRDRRTDGLWTDRRNGESSFDDVVNRHLNWVGDSQVVKDDWRRHAGKHFTHLAYLYTDEHQWRQQVSTVYTRVGYKSQNLRQNLARTVGGTTYLQIK